jgi:hypothetical protein
LIESGPKCFQSFGRSDVAAVRKGPGELDFVKISNSIHVFLNDTTVWYHFEEVVDPLFKPINVLLCPSEAALRAFERVNSSHGQEFRSDG